LAYVAVLGTIWYGWKHEKRFAFLLSGVCLGISQYFYASSRVLFAMVPVWLAVLAISDFKKFKRIVPSLLLMALSAIVTLMPMALFYLNHINFYVAPMTRVSIFGVWMRDAVRIEGKPAYLILLDQIVTGLRAYTDVPIRAWYMPGTPLLRPAPAAIFLIGLIIFLLHWKDSRTWLLVLWLFAFGALSGLSESTPAAQRFTGVIPAVALVVGYAVNEVGVLFTKIWPRRQKLVYIFAILLVVGLALDDVRFYFLDFTPHADFGGENTLIAQTLGEDLRTCTGDIEVLFAGEGRMNFDSLATLPYLAENVRYANVYYDWGSRENPRPDAQNLVFAVLPEHKNILDEVMRTYPGGKLITYPSTQNGVLFWQYDVPASAGRH
jgi:hypothetical protein